MNSILIASCTLREQRKVEEGYTNYHGDTSYVFQQFIFNIFINIIWKRISTGKSMTINTCLV